MKKRKRKFRVIRNKSMDKNEGDKITVADVEQILRAGWAEEARMAEICPEFNALMELTWKRQLGIEAPIDRRLHDENHLLWMCLMEARGRFFEHLAWMRQLSLRVKK